LVFQYCCCPILENLDTEFNLKSQLEENSEKISKNDKDLVEEAINDVLEWLSNNPNADKELYDKKKKKKRIRRSYNSYNSRKHEKI